MTEMKVKFKHAGRIDPIDLYEDDESSRSPGGSAAIDPDAELPCDVIIPPRTIIRKGCKLRTLLTGMDYRKGKDDWQTKFSR